MMMKNIVILSWVILLLSSCSASQPERLYTNPDATLPEPHSTTDIPYIDDGDIRHKLDVHLPPTDESSYPVVMAIHGGGFSSLSKDLYSYIARIYNDMGFALVATNYRYATTTSYPGQVEDTTCALAWIHTEGPKYNLDPSRIIIMGGSAGGYMASMMATHDNLNSFLGGCPHTLPSVDTHLGAVIFYGLTDFTQSEFWNPRYKTIREKLWGESQEEISQERLGELSPLTWIDSTDKPFLMLHGLNDSQIPVEMTYQFIEALELADVRAETYYPKLEHGFDILPLNNESVLEGYRKVDQFINSLIK